LPGSKSFLQLVSIGSQYLFVEISKIVHDMVRFCEFALFFYGYYFLIWWWLRGKLPLLLHDIFLCLQGFASGP